MRIAWYAGTSTALAASVVLSAFHQRPNFYSAMVYLSQSSLCLMILANLILLVYGTFMYGLQRLCFGQLRPIEIEQLYEKAWFAVTETCLAMTIFREEVGAFFLVMFTALVTGKVWGWIGDGRVEILEQQPPANPRLFHARLSVSLLLSVLYDAWLLGYAMSTVIRQARPNMMVMFLFEFAVLAVGSIQTALRYILSLVEARVTASQTRQRLEDRRRQVREQRAELLRQRSEQDPHGEQADNLPELPNEEGVDEMDIEVPGWEAKGQWVLGLDLLADFLKLSIYTAFFSVLMTFYGLPIHIMRDLFMTTRSFVKRLGALLRYRQAVREMNQYPDATAEELSRENTCIICREEMRPWDPTDSSQVERSRPKKLPCGHILHFGCLKSWLERQQVCPTCRRSVTVAGDQGARAGGDGLVFRFGFNLPGGGAQNPQPPANGAAAAPRAGPGAGQAGGANDQQPQQPQPQAPQGNGGVRMINLGPLRLGFAQGGVQDLQEMARRLGLPDDGNAAPPAVPAAANAVPGAAADNDAATVGLSQLPDAVDLATASMDTIQAAIHDIGDRILVETATLQNASTELRILQHLVTELMRVRQLNAQYNLLAQQRLQGTAEAAGVNGVTAATPTADTNSQATPQTMPQPTPTQPLAFPQAQPGLFPPALGHPPPPFAARPAPPMMTRHVAAGSASAIPAGSPELPAGLVIPPGWSLLPLQRFGAQSTGPEAANQPAPASGAEGEQENSAAAVPTENAPPPGHVPDGPSTSTWTTEAPVASTATDGLATEAAPVADLPSWGGPAQMFAGDRALPFGWRQSDATSEPLQPANGAEGGSSSSTNGNHESSTANPHEQQQEPELGIKSDKGKGKAVTVDEADEDDATL